MAPPTKSLHQLLGKFQLENGGTPISGPTVSVLYRTPEAAPDNEDSLAKRIGSKDAPEPSNTRNDSTPKVKRTAGLPRFKGSLAWAADSSPVLLRSTEKTVAGKGHVFIDGDEHTEPPAVDCASKKERTDSQDQLRAVCRIGISAFLMENLSTFFFSSADY